MDKTLVEPTPRTDALHKKYLCEGQFTPDMPELAKEVYFECVRELVAAERQLAAEKASMIGITTAWKRDYEGEKERGDLWMADCKAAEALLAEQTRLAEERKREVVDLRHDVARHVQITGTQYTEIERLERALSGTKDALKLERESVDRLSKDAQRKVYFQCKKHQGAPWTGLAMVVREVTRVCPNCEQDAAIEAHK